MQITVGMVVTIHAKIREPSYKGKYDGFCGVVERCSASVTGGNVGVRLDGLENPASGYGLFWFKQKELKEYYEEDNIMLNNYYKVNINFLEGSNTNTNYVYAAYEPTLVRPGDLVVVKTGHHGMTLARVAEPTTNLADAKVEYGREIVAVVDTSAYDERCRRAKELKELKKQMDAKVQELQAVHLYEMMAERDPALKAMLDTYKELMG